MEWYHITFRSITPAQRGERILRQSGIEATLMRALRQLSLEGCGYSLRIRAREGMRAVERLKSTGVPYRRVFYQSANGEIQELSP
ncbi:MAG: DUF3343 domain-containing protein [Ruminococcaceae bacterium]|nr:DUF3343 domain-containing protein [Oscillospiraceae bacterium]MBQ3215334.1 DUF3343 domain-containing protein [Oscillospiraceae bacterium]